MASPDARQPQPVKIPDNPIPRNDAPYCKHPRVGLGITSLRPPASTARRCSPPATCCRPSRHATLAATRHTTPARHAVRTNANGPGSCSVGTAAYQSATPPLGGESRRVESERRVVARLSVKRTSLTCGPRQVSRARPPRFSAALKHDRRSREDANSSVLPLIRPP